MNKNTRKYNKTKGQALLSVMIISTLTFILLFQIATRINVGRTSVRKTSEFNKAVALNENAINEIIKRVGSPGCLLHDLSNTKYTVITQANCSSLDLATLTRNSFTTDGSISVLGKLSTDNFIPISVNTNKNNPGPIALYVNPNTNFAPGRVGIATTGVMIKCDPATLALSPAPKFAVSRVYYDAPSSRVKIDQGIYTCDNTDFGGSGNVKFFSSDLSGKTNIVQTDPRSNPQIIKTISDTMAVRVRMFDGTANAAISIQVVNKNSSAPGGYDIVSSTDKLEFLVVAQGGLDSSSYPIKFVKQANDYNYIPSAFDYVYFGENAN